MIFRRTERFAKAYRSLQPDIQIKVNKALHLLAANPRHPSLHLKKIEGTGGIWEARIDRQHRMTLDIGRDYYLLRNVGKHDETLDKP